jgi:hypothetical protein
MFFAGLLAGCSYAAAQSRGAHVSLAPDQPSNGYLELSVKQVMRTPGPLDPAPEVWEGAIEITVKNVSTRIVHLEESDLTYELTLLDSSGNQVPSTEYGKQVEEAQRNGPSVVFNIGIYDLPPGQEHTRILGLRNFFKFEPGQDYAVRLKRWDRSMALIDETGKRVALRELSRTLTGKGRPSIR